jgi:hypothetical protein
MKTLVNSLAQINFRNFVAATALAAVCLITQPASAGTSLPTGTNPAGNVTENFQAVMYLADNSANVKIHLLNPRQEKISVSIFNEANEVVYQKQIGKPAVFHGRFSLDRIPDGTYTMVVKTNTEQISREFSIQTQVARLAQVK